MNLGQWIFLIFEVLCFSYVGYAFFMMGRNRESQYQAMRTRMVLTLKFPDKDGLYDFFAVVMVVNVMRVLYQAF